MPMSEWIRDEAAEKVWWAVEIFRDRWFVLVLHRLMDGPKRQSQFLDQIEGISQRMLTRTLRHMERDGLVTRRVVKDKPLHIEYELSELGHSLKPVLVAVLQWSQTHRLTVEDSRCRARL